MVGERTSDSLIPKKELGSHAECFESLTVVLQPAPYRHNFTTLYPLLNQAEKITRRGTAKRLPSNDSHFGEGNAACFAICLPNHGNCREP